MSEILVGSIVESTSNVPKNYFCLGRFQAIASGTGATEFRVWSNASGYIKVGVYADSAGEPGARLGYNDTQQAVVVGWNILTISATNITSGTYYWLGGDADTNEVMRIEASGGTYRYRAETFSTFVFPNPAGAGFSSDNYIGATAVWGDVGGGRTTKNTASNALGVRYGMNFGMPR